MISKTRSTNIQTWAKLFKPYMMIFTAFSILALVMHTNNSIFRTKLLHYKHYCEVEDFEKRHILPDPRYLSSVISADAKIENNTQICVTVSNILQFTCFAS